MRSVKSLTTIFSVWGSADTEYIAEHDDERTKRNAIGVYEKSGLSQYTEKNKNIQYGTGVNFPSNWEPRYAIAGGVGAAPDHREDYKVHKSGPREPAVKGADGSYIVNAKDSPNGIVINGTLPTNEAQGVHSLTDVPVFAMGPCQETFGGTYNNVDIFYKMATCLGLARTNTEGKKPKKE